MTNYKENRSLLSLIYFEASVVLLLPLHVPSGGSFLVLVVSCLVSSAQCRESCFQFITTIELLFRYLLSNLHRRRLV
jgi:hypothetical protein